MHDTFGEQRDTWASRNSLNITDDDPKMATEIEKSAMLAAPGSKDGKLGPLTQSGARNHLPQRCIRNTPHFATPFQKSKDKHQKMGDKRERSQKNSSAAHPLKERNQGHAIIHSISEGCLTRKHIESRLSKRGHTLAASAR